MRNRKPTAVQIEQNRAWRRAGAKKYAAKRKKALQSHPALKRTQFRKKVSKAQKRRIQTRRAMKAALLAEAGEVLVCGFTGHAMRREEADLCHRNPVGMRGGKDEDVRENVFLGCHLGNLAQGSMRLEEYMKLPYEVRRRNCGFRGE